MDKLISKLQKNVDTLNKIYLPREYVKQYGKHYYMEIYEDGTIKLIPIKEGE